MALQDTHDIFEQSHPKSLIIDVSDGTRLTNTNIVSEKLELIDSLCSEKEIVFGSCESACLKLQVATADKEFAGLWLDVNMAVSKEPGFILKSDNESYIVTDIGSKIKIDEHLLLTKIGRFKVVLDEPVADRSWRNLTCYDEMYDILKADVASWYQGLTFPMTIKQLRDSFFSYLNVTQETVTLINDNLSVQGGFVANGALYGRTIIKAICELNGVFGHMNSQGKMDYISIPSAESVTYGHYIDGTGSYEREVVQPITGIIARDQEEDAGTIVGTMDNPYIITGNPLVFGIEGTQDLEDALTALLDKIDDITYRPFGVQSYGDPALPIGTSVVVNTRDMTINSFIMTRVLTGVQALRDYITATGNEYRENDITDLQSELTQIKGREHILRADVDELTSIISDPETGLVSEISQLSDEIVLKVDNNGKVVNVALTADPDTGTAFKVLSDNIDFISNGKIQLTSKSLEINSTKFQVTTAGAVTCSDITISGGSLNINNVFKVATDGKITSTGGTIGGWNITTNALYNGMTSLSDTTHNGVWIGQDGIASGKGSFKVTSSGAVTASNLTITGGSINLGSGVFTVSAAGAVSCSNLTITGGSITLGSTFNVTSAGAITATSGTIGGLSLASTAMYYNVTSMSDSSHSGIYVGRDGIRIYKVISGSEDGICNLSSGGITTQSLYVKNSTGAARIVFEANDTGASTRLKNLTVTGTKSRMSETQDYGNVLLYCYETPTPMFGDIGEGKIAEDGKCYIWTDAKFAQTISNESYQVFLQKYGQGECYVTERKANYFVVEGDAGMTFGWEIKAKQSGYETLRLDKEEYWGVERIDYASLAGNHLQTIKKVREVA